jgi:hypothetical protein
MEGLLEMRHSEIDKRARRTRPRQCVADYGHNVHKDAPEWVKSLPPLELPFQAVPLAEWLRALARRKYGMRPEDDLL